MGEFSIWNFLLKFICLQEGGCGPPAGMPPFPSTWNSELKQNLSPRERDGSHPAKQDKLHLLTSVRFQ